MTPFEARCQAFIEEVRRSLALDRKPRPEATPPTQTGATVIQLPVRHRSPNST